MTHPGQFEGMARPGAAWSAALAGWGPRAAPTFPPESALNWTVRCSFQPGGIRSVAACNDLVRLGLDPARLFSLEGGIIAWADQVDPTLPKY